MIVEKEFTQTGEVRVSFKIAKELWEELKLTKNWQNVELAVCDGYVKSLSEVKSAAKGTIIASDGKITRICVGGKEYSDGITGVEFSHRVGMLRPQFEITADTVDLKGKGNLDDFMRFLRNLMGFSV